MRDAYPKFEKAGVELYTISYDDQEALSEFAKLQNIPYRMLSDVDSNVIRQFGILNELAITDGAFMAGIPFPGAYATDEQGIVVAKYFFASHQKRESPELLLDAALGRIVASADAPTVEGGDDKVRLSAFVHGGNGSLRFGMRRQIVVRIEPAEGLYLYGQRVGEDLNPASVVVTTPSKVVVEPANYPIAEHVQIEGSELPVWSGNIGIAVPLYINNEIGDHRTPIQENNVEFDIEVQYQIYADATLQPLATEVLKLSVPIDDLDLPNLSTQSWHGHKAAFDSNRHFRRLVSRKTRQSPMGLLRFFYKIAALKFTALIKR